MTYSANDIANWILYLAAEKGLSLSQMQLQKCLYYAQGYSLGMSGEKLFNEKIFAWQHGPVVPEVYREFKRFAANKITPPKTVGIPEDIYGVLDVIVNEKGIESAASLRNATHIELPYSSTCLNEEITPDKLELFFTGFFWTSDEEDIYEPDFDTEEEALRYFRETITPEEKELLANAKTK